MIEPEKYFSLLKEADKVRKDFLDKLSRKPKSSGGPNYYVMALRRSSRTFSGIVMDAYKSGQLDGSKAGQLLNVRESNFPKFEKFIYKK